MALNRRDFLTGVAAGLLLPAGLRGGELTADPFLEDLEQRAYRYFEEQSDPSTGVTRGSARADGSDFPADRVPNGSVMVSGFGLVALCIAAERGWTPHRVARDRVARTLRFFLAKAAEDHGWFYHWIDLRSGRRAAPLARGDASEVSSVDSAFFLAGALTAKGYFAGDGEIAGLTDALYHRIDFPWMLAKGSLLLSHGWTPEAGQLKPTWNCYSEAMILYLLAIGSPTRPIAPQAWDAWRRDENRYAEHRFVGVTPLFTFQYSHALVDFRGLRDKDGSGPDWFENSRIATRAHRQFCLDLRREFPDYADTLWGITTSESARGYVEWGGPPREPGIDGTVVPCAPGGSLMFEPELCLRPLRAMRQRYGDRLYGRYGFADAFNPLTRWTSRNVQGLDVGITLLAAENLRTGNLWRWFMRAPEIQRALSLARLTRSGSAPVRT